MLSSFMAVGVLALGVGICVLRLHGFHESFIVFLHVRAVSVVREWARQKEKTSTNHKTRQDKTGQDVTMGQPL